MPAPRLIRLNEALAEQLGLDPEQLASPEGVEILAGNRVPQGADPLAMAYAGFQYGGWVPSLGDGRAVLLGELIDRDGVRHDVHLKGAGRTPFTRMGDGRAVLGPVLREYIVSEAMAALGVPTTRALAALCTGQRIMRETYLPGALLVRVAESHIRIGTFQYFGGRRDVEGLRLLADHVIARHYPEAAESDAPYLALLDNVIGRQAQLIAHWQWVGFIHGVMNTDNTTINGETLDYGPCAFMDTFHPETVYSSIDFLGRYAYGNQPPIMRWNLTSLAETLLPLLGPTKEAATTAAMELLDTFPKRFQEIYERGLLRKLGLSSPQIGDKTLAQTFLNLMEDHKADFTLTFRRLCDAATTDAQQDGPLRALFDKPVAFDEWAKRWRERLQQDERSDSERQKDMRQVNPAFIPRNHRVEEVIRAAEDHDDFAPFDRLMRVLATPYDDQSGACSRASADHFASPPRPDQVVQQTFCGT